MKFEIIFTNVPEVIEKTVKAQTRELETLVINWSDWGANLHEPVASLCSLYFLEEIKRQREILES